MSQTNNSSAGSGSANLSFLQTISIKIVDGLENFFYIWGYNIAFRPGIFICTCFIFTILCGFGLLSFTTELRPDKLWIPWNSDFVRDTEWLNKNYPSPFRFHYAIITADDVLQPEVFNVVLDLHEKVRDLNVSGYSWNDLCFRLPVIKFANHYTRKRDTNYNMNDKFEFPGDFDKAFDDFGGNISEKSFDPSISLPVDVYCNIVSSLNEECYESNILELWSYDALSINNLTREDILEVVNHEKLSPVFGLPVNYSTELGQSARNESGHIISAKALMIRWFASLNRTAMDNGEVITDEGTGQAVDIYNFLWEEALSQFLLHYKPPEGIHIYFNVARSFADISVSTIWNDAYKLAFGFSIVFMYVIFMLGKFNLVEQRPILSLAGLSCVGLAIVCAYGICSAFRLIYGPVHNVLPFLLLGLGIDDMFVIMQCWNNLEPEDMKRTLPEKLGLSLKHAGVSITVTSLTDFFAFAIGGTTVLPALQSFCIYAALGIIATYIFQATFFVAWMAIDEKRIMGRRNAFFPCFTHPSFDFKIKKGLAQVILKQLYCKMLFNKITKCLVFLIMLVVLGVNMWGIILLRQEFNPIWFLPQNSYLFQYFAARDQYFPEKGHEGIIVMHGVDFESNLATVNQLILSLEKTLHVSEIESWYLPFKEYMNDNYGIDISNKELSKREFHNYLGKFLFSPLGGKFQASFKFDGNLRCGYPAPRPLLSSFAFKFKSFKGPEEHIPAMNAVKNAVHIANFTPNSSYAFVWSFGFAGWETDEIITVEVYRNMGLAMICIFCTTLALIANFKGCLIVLVCVILTLVDIGGSMHFWNLTIDTVSCIDLVLAIGLSVDFSSHIVHTFMTCVGTREERSKQALINIGPAVLNGGFSTFLAFILLAGSHSHVFITFFKIFFLVVVYGLFHGMVFLPVLLSLIGPDAYFTATINLANECSDENKTDTQMKHVDTTATDQTEANMARLLPAPE